ncbi:hypothetical protein GSbR_04990 [Geobacter sp. SVR]|nr:hypothetical protein GSVR_09710 [Geobacter sp. SVR]GCF83899.1 hypothetical protein GSbR_04990 [Geobacter sp. SVR]
MIVYSGPNCAEKNIDPATTLKDLPDLTKFTSSAAGGPGGSGGSGSSGSHASDRKRAIEYLVLREEKLVSSFNTSYTVLKAYYNKMQTTELTDEEIKHINIIESHAPQALKLTQLQKCYNYNFWLEVGIKRLGPQDNGYLKGIRDILIKNHDIPADKLKATNKWLKNIDGVPQLK